MLKPSRYIPCISGISKAKGSAKTPDLVVNRRLLNVATGTLWFLVKLGRDLQFMQTFYRKLYHSMSRVQFQYLVSDVKMRDNLKHLRPCNQPFPLANQLGRSLLSRCASPVLVTVLANSFDLRRSHFVLLLGGNQSA
jgi:hypothetical protein